jgi:hypothetical protein
MRPGQFMDAGNNINCRCQTVDIIENNKPTKRTGVNPVTGKTETFSYKDYSQWAKDNDLKKNKYGRVI